MTLSLPGPEGTAAQKRRKRQHRTATEKRQIVEETLLPGASVSLVARRHDVNANQVFGWRRLYRKGELGSGTFVPVGVVPSIAPVSAKVIEIELGNGARLRVDSDVGPGVLERILEVVRRPAC